METYELVVVTDSSKSESDRKQQLEQITKLIIADKGKIIEETTWGKKEFAYPIKKISSGVYTEVIFESNPSLPESLSKKLVLDENILRFLIVKKEIEKLKKQKPKDKTKK